FSMLGPTCGGEGKSPFALPDVGGSVPLHPGQGPGLSLYDLGEVGGSPTVTLQISEIPSHPHPANADTGVANSGSPAGNVYKEGQTTNSPPEAIASYNNSLAPMVALNFQTIGLTGSSAPHNNMMPTLCLNFCIALQGVFPSRP